MHCYLFSAPVCRQILDMLTSYLSDVSEAGETAAEFIGLYEKLIAANHWKYYLTVSPTRHHLARLVAAEGIAVP